MNDPLDLKKFIRNVKDFPIEGIEFRDITSLIETPEAFVKTCKELTHISREFSATAIASIESRGFIFAGSIACDLALPFVLARKPGKLPNKTLVYPAHDYNNKTESTIENERKNNPRLQVKSADEYADIMNNLNLPRPAMMDIAIPRNLKLGKKD